jgi:hypothetical protein
MKCKARVPTVIHYVDKRGFKVVKGLTPLYECCHYVQTIKLCTCKVYSAEPVFGNVSRSPGIDSASQRDGTSNRIVVPARQAGNRFLGPLKRFKNSGSV